MADISLEIYVNSQTDTNIYSSETFDAEVGDTVEILGTTQANTSAVRYGLKGDVTVPGCTYSYVSGSYPVYSLKGTLSSPGTYILQKVWGSSSVGVMDNDGSKKFGTITINVVKPNYTVSFNSNGGSSNPSSQTVASGTSITLPSPGSRTGYTFDGWYSAIRNTVVGGAGATYTPSGSEELIARWTEIVYTHNLYYNANGGSGAPGAQSQNTNTNTSYRFTISSTVPTRTNYEFLGWSTSSTATSASYQPGGSITVGANSAITLYAVWKQIYNYWIIFSARDGYNETTIPSIHEPSTSTSKYITIPDTIPTRSGYEFLGWSEDRDATEVQYRVGSSVYLTSSNPSVTLYAVWAKAYTYTMVFELNGGVNGPENQVVTSTSTEIRIQIPYSPVPTRDGYEFDGYELHEDPMSGEKLNPGDYVTFRADQLLTMRIRARWLEIYTYTLSFNANNGTGAPSGMSATSTDVTYSFIIPSTEPVRDKYSFAGWATSSTATEPEYLPNGSITIRWQNPSVTLYAVWKEIIAYSLIYNLNGGYISNPSDTDDRTDKIESLEPITPDFTITNLFPTKDGTNLIFIGWSKSADATAAEYASGDPYVWDTAQGEFANTLYAVYVVGFRYTVIYDVDGDTSQIAGYDQILAENTKEYIVTNATPVKEGAAFIGWGRSKSETNLYQSGDSIQLTPDQPLTLYAYWSYSNELIDEPTSIQGSYDPETGRGQCFIDITYSRGTVQARENHTKLFMPIINGINHSYSASLTEIPTVIYGSDNTFVTDLGVTERISVSVSRVNPEVIDDVGGMVSGQIHKLSNKRWWHILKTALDYWQNFGHRIYGDRRVRTGGFRFFYQPYCTDLYPTIDKNVFLSGTLAPTFTPQKLSFDLNMVVSRMAQETKEQEMATITYKYTYGGTTSTFTEKVSLGAYYTISEKKLDDNGNIIVMNWSNGKYTYEPGSAVIISLTDDGRETLQVTQSGSSYGVTLTGTVAEVIPIMTVLQMQTFSAQPPKYFGKITSDYEDKITAEYNDYSAKITFAQPISARVQFTIIGAGGGGGGGRTVSSQRAYFGGGGGSSGCSMNRTVTYAALDTISYQLGVGGAGGITDKEYESDATHPYERIGPAENGGDTVLYLGANEYRVKGGNGSTGRVNGTKVMEGAPAVKDENGPLVDSGETDSDGNPIKVQMSTSGAGGAGGGASGSTLYPDLTDGKDGLTGYDPMFTRSVVGIGGTSYTDGSGSRYSCGGGGGGAASFVDLGLKGTMLGIMSVSMVSQGGDGFRMSDDGNFEHTSATPGRNGGGGGGGSKRYSIDDESETYGAKGGDGAVAIIISSYKVVS